MTDLRKQVFQAIEQLAFHYQGDKADLEKLIDVVVELIQKREAEAKITELTDIDNTGIFDQPNADDLWNDYYLRRVSQLKNEGEK